MQQTVFSVVPVVTLVLSSNRGPTQPSRQAYMMVCGTKQKHYHVGQDLFLLVSIENEVLMNCLVKQVEYSHVIFDRFANTGAIFFKYYY